MTRGIVVRRVAVTLGLAVAILAAAGTILAAGRWTATDAPLAVAPVSVQYVQAALDQERQRSAALEQQLATLEGASGDLSAALAAAQGQLAVDASTAADLFAALDGAQAKLAKLEAALKAAAAARTTTTVVTTRANTTTSNDREREHEDEDEGEEHDDD
jgi:chromosome segregation ATPase